MSEIGFVKSIYVAPDAGEPMEFADMVELAARIGIVDDRYGMGKGSFQRAGKQKIRHLSLISTEAIEAVNQDRAFPFTEGDTRRNIITAGIDLNNLVGVEFSIGNIALRGTELCDPCVRPSVLSGNKGFKEAFQNRGGLRAEVLSSGLIVVGDTVSE
jgi:hypothetical protein